MTGSRRLSEAISEGDGISLLVEVDGADAARAAEEQGAEGMVVYGDAAGAREATELPILWCGRGRVADARDAGADAYLLVDAVGEGRELQELYAEVLELGLDCVVKVTSEEELELAFERVDPDIVLLDGGDGGVERVLELLPDVPAGKLAIADLRATTRDALLELERAGVDAVVVRAGENVAELVGGAPTAA